MRVGKPWKHLLLCIGALIGTIYFIIPLLHYAMEYKKFGNPPETPYFDKGILERPLDKKFTILFWAHGPRMIRRFVRSYGKTDLDPFLNCPYNNCQYRTDDLAGLNVSDAVVIHLHRTKSPSDLPPYRRPDQHWIFFTDESPKNTFLLSQKYSMSSYDGLFNWSMTYRSDSDVPVPYGRTINLKEPLTELPDYFARNDKGVAVMGSNCGGDNHRWDYIHELQKHIPVDVYGGCGTIQCPGGFMKDCPLLKGYKFYLAFENCNCREYITEKLWWNAFAKESIPVVMGASPSDYRRLSPTNSHIHVEDFKSPKDLARHLRYLTGNRTAYNEYFQWKLTQEVLNEHGYFHSPSRHICHLCEALNRDSPLKVYHQLKSFWNPKKDCRKSKWSLQ